MNVEGHNVKFQEVVAAYPTLHHFAEHYENTGELNKGTWSFTTRS
jgi:hypothetical protein